MTDVVSGCGERDLQIDHRRSAFGDRRAHRPGAAAGEYSRYLIAQTLGAGINLVVFAVTLWLVPTLREHLMLPLALGSICALFFNYGAMQCYVFPQRAASTNDGPKQPA
jgi:putative flippase GtrA